MSWLLAELSLCISDLFPCLFSLLSSSLPLTVLTPLSLSSLLLSPEEKYGREVCVIPADFSGGQEIYPRIAEELQDLDIGVLGKVPSLATLNPWPCCVAGLTLCMCVCVTLVNNVGYAAEYPDYFVEIAEDVSCEEQQLSIFCCFFDMCQLLFP